MLREYGELLDAVRGVRWQARRPAGAGLPGAHRSRMRGSTGEFTEYRSYRQGDDPARVDWKLFARSDRPYVRLSNDRSTVATMLLLDATASMAFPGATLGKWRLACDIAVALAVVAHATGDPVGIAIAGGTDARRVTPRSRRGAVSQIMRATLEAAPSGDASLADVLGSVTRSARRVVVISDFLGDAAETLAVAARFVAAGGELDAVHVVAREEITPPTRDALVSDPERASVRRPLVASNRAEYMRAFAAWRAALADGWRAAGIPVHDAVAGEERAERVVRRIAGGRGGAKGS